MTRQERVLAVALETFIRFGFRKTSMDDVARAADISRPGLYFLFDSKQSLFQAAVTHGLDNDLETARRSLEDAGRPVRERLIEALQAWTGRYVGPAAREMAVLMETSPDLLGPIADGYPPRFAAMVVDAIEAEVPQKNAAVATDVARTLLSAAAGIKHEVATREEFTARATVAVDLLLAAIGVHPETAAAPAIGPGPAGQ